MKGAPAIYLDRIIDKSKFRAFIYDIDGNKKLIESWDSYEAHMSTGIWFSSKKENSESSVIEIKSEEKSKSKSKPKNTKMKEPPQKAACIAEDKMVFEVTDENK